MARGTSEQDLLGVVERLARGGVSFVIVGGLAAVTQGAPVSTFDVDIVHERIPENVDRLMAVLDELGAVYRRPGDLKLGPDRDALLGPGHSLFTTSLGPLDCLGAIEEGMDYGALVPLSLVIPFRDGSVRVLGLETIVRLKRASVHDKDRAILPVLEATLMRIQAGRGST